MKKISVVLVIGTRPEAIKLAPVYLELKKSTHFEPQLWSSGQHNQMLLQTLHAFDLTPDRNLEIMTQAQTLSTITSKILTKLENAFNEKKPDLVIVQGDTSTAFATSLSCFYHKIPLAHVEAGLRTETKFSPFPEEMNRRIVSQLADYHFAPTGWSYQNLLKEGFSENRILQTGNTVIDALDFTLNKLSHNPSVIPEIIKAITSTGKKIILITGHRRENFGKGFEDLCMAIKKLALKFKDHIFIYPVHLNPNVQEPVRRLLSDIDNIFLTEPLEYEPFVYLMSRSYFIISDSGGIQEEAPHLGKPVLVTRESTERPEAISAGTAKLVGTNQDSIYDNAEALIENVDLYNEMSTAKNPYGDGKSSERISLFLKDAFLTRP